MDISTYCRQVSFSDKTLNIENSNRIVFLGLIGEIGSILTECKKTLREGKDNRSKITERLVQEMGDSLWYITAITLRYDLDLRRDVIKANIDHITGLKICSEFAKKYVAEKLDTMPNRLPSDFDEYQDIAWHTATSELRDNEDELLARLIRKASHFMRYFSSHRSEEKDITLKRLEKLLGDILWYIAVFSFKNKIKLNDVAEYNYNKTVNRWRVNNERHTKRLDSRDKPEERLPNNMSFIFTPISKDQVEIKFENQDIIIGDPLDDNTEVEDGYRYHDAFHLAFAAILTWSPVLRKLLRLGEGEEINKKQNFHRFNSSKDSTEDGARAQIVEEAIAKIVHSHAEDIDPEKLLSEKETVSTELLDQIKLFTRKLEVHHVKQWEWEIAVIQACRIYVKLIENNGGRVKLDLKARSISYETV